MREHVFGPTGVSLPVVGQGTWKIDEHERGAAIYALQRGLDRGMRHIDTAELYGMGAAEEVVELLTDAQRRFALSLHDTASGDGEQSVLELIPDEDADNILENVEQESLNAYVASLIRELPEREQNILALYYFEDLTLREIGSLLSLTEARISQILGKIMLKLRKRLNGPQRVAA